MGISGFLKLNSLRRTVGNKKGIETILILSILLLATCIFINQIPPVSAVGPTTVLLGSATSFSVLAGSGITNTGSTTIYGDVGTFPTISETGFESVTLIGTNHMGDAVTQQAKTDLVAAYNNAAGRTPVTTVPTELGNTTLTAGVYNSQSGTFGITGTLILDGQGDPNAVFIFQMASTLITAPGSVVSLINGARSCNVFWQVSSSATIDTTSTFVGNILALTSITVNTGTTVDGRLLARNGAVTLQSNTIGQTVHLEGIVLTPVNSTNPVGASHTVTATVSGTGDPVVGRNVNFTVVSGPNAGLTGSAITDSNGHASFTYIGNLTGTDTIEARFANSQGATVVSNQVTKTWTTSGAAISVVKQISVDNSTWVDADLPPGILVTVGSNVYFRFTVTNIGTVELSNITLTDNTYDLSGATIPSSLAPDASFVYYFGQIPALLGQHTNIATTTGQFNNIMYNSTNNANYNGTPESVPGISVVKQISINNVTWVDADVPPGIAVIVGSNVYYKFVVTNVGNVELTNITLTDNTYTLTCLMAPSTLATNASFTYFLGPIKAQLGQHTNTATATGTYNNITYSNTNNANYNGTQIAKPSICIVKYVSVDCGKTWCDANCPPGPTVLAGKSVYFKFEVKNTGNVALSNISLADIPFIDFSNANIPTTLQPGKSFKVIIGPLNAGLLQNSDNVTVTGTYANVIYSDSDKANYYGTLCTYTPCEYAGTCTTGKLINSYYKTSFSTGLQVGYYDSNSGFGYRWTSDKASSLLMFLKSTGTSGPIRCDKLNPVNTKNGGGTLAVQTATLTINIAFSDLSIKGMPSGLERLALL